MNDPANIFLEFSKKAQNELTGDILPFWANKVLLRNSTDFAGQMKNDLTIVKNGPKGPVLVGRMLWTFSASYLALGVHRYKDCADASYNFLKRFLDPGYSGVYWLLDSNFEPKDTTKVMVAQAFAITGLAEYFKVTKNERALTTAIELFHTIEKYSHDPNGTGYLDGHDRAWNIPAGPVKSFETHFNLMHAYANLLRVWEDDFLRRRLKGLLDIMMDKFTDRSFHQLHFFDKDWTAKENTIQFGHDMIVSWLLVDCAEVLGNLLIIEKAKAYAVKIAHNVIKMGYDKEYGGIYHSITADGKIITVKVWWPQAEAAVGFLNAFQISGNQEFLNASLDTWNFIDKYLVDREFGEWYYSTTREGLPHKDLLKVSEWKCPFHNGRACLEIIKRSAKCGNSGG